MDAFYRFRVGLLVGCLAAVTLHRFQIASVFLVEHGVALEADAVLHRRYAVNDPRFVEQFLLNLWRGSNVFSDGV
jgi:hypothetical protein